MKGEISRRLLDALPVVWRVTLAADRLADTPAAIAEVARSVGYSDPFGFSAAFKRGVSPSEFRRTSTSTSVSTGDWPISRR